MNDTIWGDGVWAAGVWADGVWAARHDEPEPEPEPEAIVARSDRAFILFAWGSASRFSRLRWGAT